MKRFHVHVSVDDLDASIQFYSTVFGASQTVVKPDYAKWMVDDPRINFAISKRGSATAIDHLGIKVDSDEQLTALCEQVTGAQIVAQDQPEADCCYARSDKYWTTDPQEHRVGAFPHPRYHSRLRRQFARANARLLRYRTDRRYHD